MDAATIITLILANKEEILGTMGVIVMAASKLAQYTTNQKDDRFLTRLASIIDIFAMSTGKASPQNSKNTVMKLAKHAITGKFDQ